MIEKLIITSGSSPLHAVTVLSQKLNEVIDAVNILIDHHPEIIPLLRTTRAVNKLDGK